MGEYRIITPNACWLHFAVKSYSIGLVLLCYFNFFSLWVYEFQFSRRWLLKIQFDQTFIKLREMGKYTMIFTVVEPSKVLSLILILYQNQYCWFTMDSYIWVRFIKIKINIQSAVLIFCLFCYIWFCNFNSSSKYIYIYIYIFLIIAEWSWEKK